MSLKVGVIGAGNISGIYFENDRLFKDFSLVACADIVMDAAQSQANKYGVDAHSVDDLLARDDIDAVVNLTIPDAHAEVSRKALEAGKHVYSEKPLAIDLQEAADLVAFANQKGLRVGCAPDTVLGAGTQRARQMIDNGEIGKPLSVNAAVMSHGMEAWHPNPHFFFQPGAGPVLDIGPYYVASFISLFGPVDSVIASAQTAFPTRTVATEGPRKGDVIPVNTPTTVHSILKFASGVQAVFLASWDVWKHGMVPIEVHGETASMRVPDPNFFGGTIHTAPSDGEGWKPTETTDGVFGAPNWPIATPKMANYRGLGLADMAAGIVHGRPHRASGEMALHTVAIMLGILKAADSGVAEKIDFPCDRPAALSEDEARALLA